MPSILDSCQKAETLHAFLDTPETVEGEPDGWAADTAAHLLSGCPSCRQYLQVSLAQPRVPSRVAKALQALGPDHPAFFQLWFADRPQHTEPPPEMELAEESAPFSSQESGRGPTSPSKAAYVESLAAYAHSLSARPLSQTEHLALARNLTFHAVDRLPDFVWRLDHDERMEALESVYLAAWEAAFRMRHEQLTEHYDQLLDTILSMGHSDRICESATSLAVVEQWREGRIDKAAEKVEDELILADLIPAWHRLWRGSLFYLLTGDPLAVVRLSDYLRRETAECTEGAERRFSALKTLLRASLIADNEPAAAGRLG